MAGLNMFPIMIILLLANCALPTLAHLDDSPAVVECKKHFNIKYKFDLPGPYGAGRPCHNVFVNSTFTYEHIGNITAIQARANRCKKHFSIKYAFDVYNYIFKGKKIGDFSCQALVAVGRLCHNVFVNKTFTYEHTGNKTAIEARADRLHYILMCNAYFSRNLCCSSNFKHVQNYCPLYGYSYDRNIPGLLKTLDRLLLAFWFKLLWTCYTL
ncbi:unnamed protein product [Malus baccata var. baccata]